MIRDEKVNKHFTVERLKKLKTEAEALFHSRDDVDNFIKGKLEDEAYDIYVTNNLTPNGFVKFDSMEAYGVELDFWCREKEN